MCGSINVIQNTVIITRAVSGSGKTAITKRIISFFEKHDITIGIHSTDDLFVVDGRYIFDARRLAEFHRRNFENYMEDLKKDKKLVICDNMNLLPWQSEPYTTAARQYGYKIIFINFLPKELPEHVAAQQVTVEKPDAHGLSEELLVRFIEDFKTYNDLLDKNCVVDTTKHFTYRWDEKQLKRVKTDYPIRRFDFDDVITIKSGEYEKIQGNIGKIILNIMEDSNL
jgi:hypothetical protein